MIYKNALITTKDEQFLGWIEIDDNTKFLTKIGKGETEQDGIDCNENILMPGFIDSHTHGGYGFSFDHLDDEKLLNNYLNELKKEGIVAVIGTSVTTSIDGLKSKLESIFKTINDHENDKVKIVGWYFEGPFISKAKKGAHQEDLIIPIDEDFLKIVKTKANNVPIVFTFDAEHENNKKIVKKYDNDFIFALGHSNANYNDAKFVLNNGTKRITHLYNAMSGFTHSGELGIINTIFNHEFLNNLCIELIADGVHVSDHVIKYTYNNINIDNLTLVTDSLSPKGLGEGFYKLGNLDIEKRGNWFYLKNTKTLSGSGVTYNWLLKHFKNVTNCSWEDIVKVSSYNSARNLGLENNYGDFIIGKKINFVLIDNEFNVIKTFI